MRRSSLFAVVASLSLAAMAAGGAQAEGTKTIKLHQAPPALAQIDLGAAGTSHGDILAFEAGLTGENGTKATLMGILTTIDIAEGEDAFEDRSGQIYVDFGSGNSLVIAGKSVYQNNGQLMVPGAPQLRAVVGGTGDYIGARGQVTTTRNDDGSYEHVIELVD